jgi:glucokinase
LHGKVRRLTPAREPETLLNSLVGIIGAFPEGLPVGIGIAGLVSLDGTVRYGPNIGIRDVPVAAWLRQRLSRPVIVINDGSAATVAEQRVGAARGHLDVVMFTLGTGLGGGVISGGNLLLGRSGYAGEVGHLIVADGGRPCPCGNHGCIEAYASGTAIGSMAAERLGVDGAGSTLHDVRPLDGRAVSDAARRGDAFARTILGEVGGWLGVAAASIVNTLDPEVILVGGGAASSTAEWVLPSARRAMADRVVGTAFRELPAIEVAVALSPPKYAKISPTSATAPSHTASAAHQVLLVCRVDHRRSFRHRISGFSPSIC